MRPTPRSTTGEGVRPDRRPGAHLAGVAVLVLQRSLLGPWEKLRLYEAMPIELTESQMRSVRKRVDVREPDDCWPWTGSTDRNGYPRLSVKVDGRVVTVIPYRVLWEDEYGDELGDLEIDHLCQRRDCCNYLHHLEPVTRVENNQRMWETREPVTHCVRGHEFDDENTYVTPDGRRQCRICRRASTRRYQKRR